MPGERVELTIHNSVTAGHANLVVSGQVDVSTADQLVAAMFSALEIGPLTLDLSGVTFMDSSGLRQLVLARQFAADRAVTFAIVATSKEVADLLRVTALSDAFLPDDGVSTPLP